MSGTGVVWCVYRHYHDRVLLLPLLPAEEDHCCDPLCLTFTEHHLWPQATALATMNTSLTEKIVQFAVVCGPRMMNDFKQMNSSLGCTVDYKPRQSSQTTHLLTKMCPLVAAESNF